MIGLTTTAASVTLIASVEVNVKVLPSSDNSPFESVVTPSITTTPAFSASVLSTALLNATLTVVPLIAYNSECFVC